jgi:hypothetical protein
MNAGLGAVLVLAARPATDHDARRETGLVAGDRCPGLVYDSLP